MHRTVEWAWILAMIAGCGGAADEDAGPEPCPEQAPAQDDPCPSENATCTYMDCEGLGVATATCRSDGAWDLNTSVCTELECEGQTCMPGSICVRTVAGFPQGECVDNPCGTGPIGCECPGCPDGQGCTSWGLAVECNACEAEICP